MKTNLDIDYLCCGIWNYETISSLEHYLTVNNEPTFVWNIWICGYRNSRNEKKSEPIQVASVFNFHIQKEKIVPPFLQIAPLKTCFSGENIVYKRPEFNNEIWIIKDEMYFDMESRWIEFVASKYRFPRLILKVPFDFIWKNNSLIKWIYMENLGEILDLLINLPYCDYLERILNWMNLQ